MSITERIRRRFSKKSNNLIESNEKIKQKKGKKINQKNKTRNNKEKEIKQIILQPPMYQRKKKKIDNPPIKKSKKAHKKLGEKSTNNKMKEIIQTNNIDSKRKIASNNKNIEDIIENTEKILVFNDDELNGLSYDEAKKFDYRTYCLYYISLLKTNHEIAFTFFYNSDYNSKIIKINLFIIGFTLFFALNTLFFDDNTMHKIYEDQGTFDLLYQMPQIIYSSIISGILKFLLTKFALTEELILNIKGNKNTEDLDKRVTSVKKNIKIYFIFYFINSTIILLFFWYYISMFCAIYMNTQTHLLKDTLISYAISFISPFFIYLIPGFFRIPALTNRKAQRKYLYNCSKFLQMILSL